MTLPIKFLSDSPLGKDHFGRSHFARALAKALVLPEDSDGLVIGIEGAWGTGKSFVINQIKPMLYEHNPSTIVVEFNPWVISGTDSLIEALLEQLSSSIGSKLGATRKDDAIKAGSSILKYLSLVRHLKHLKYVPGVTALGNIAEDLADLADKTGLAASEGGNDLSKLEQALPNHNLTERKDAAVTALAELGCPIVIVLDDLDRLPADEIRSVFQAVKAVANFPRTAYLLSYDPSIAAKALDQDEKIGLRYLEKIVQVQCPIPVSLPWRTRSFVLSKINEAIAISNCHLSKDEIARLEETASYVARLCRTPRDTIRICNRLRISLPATAEEVDACDVVLLEAIAVCEPSIAEAIRQWPEDFTEPARLEFETFGQEFYFVQAAERVAADKEKTNKQATWRKHIKGQISVYADAALSHLFPETRSIQSIRVQNWERLYRYLSLGPAEFITEIRDLKELISDLKALQDALTSDDKSALSILRSIELYHSQLKIPDAIAFVKCLCLCATMRMDKNNDDWRQLASQYSETIELVTRYKSEAREALIKTTIEHSPISISQALLTQAAADLGIWESQNRDSIDSRRLLELSDYKKLLKLWLRKVKSRFNAGIDLKKEPLIYAALYRIGQLGGNYSLSRAIGKKLIESGDLRHFMRSTQLTGTFEPTYGHLDIIWDREQLIKVIKREPKGIERYQKAIKLLESREAKDYFNRRSTKPTVK